MMFLAVLLSVAAVLEARPSLNLKPSVDAHFIINGEDAEEGAWPWQLSLQLGAAHVCGAVLYTENVAITAAHCCDGFNPDNMRIVAGMHRLDQDESEWQAVSLVSHQMHELYGEGFGSYPNDVALLHLDGVVDMSPDDVSGIELAREADGDLTDHDCWITGWGRYHQNMSQELSNILQEANTDVIDNDYCQQLMTGVIGADIIDSHICVYNDHHGACSGDSGGPMSCRPTVNDDFILAGVTSWGIVSLGSGCQVSYPSVYTRISSHADWIDENMPA